MLFRKAKVIKVKEKVSCSKLKTKGTTMSVMCDPRFFVAVKDTRRTTDKTLMRAGLQHCIYVHFQFLIIVQLRKRMTLFLGNTH